MALNLADAPELVTPGDLGDELASFTRAMRAANVSPNTILAYGGAVRQFGMWLMARSYPTDVRKIEPRHVDEWIGSILETNKPATAHNRWRGLQRFFNWYADIDDDFVSPMRELHPPRLPKLMPRVLAMDELRAVLATCAGSSFEDRRENALLRILFDTGARRAEVAGLRHSPTDPDDRDVDSLLSRRRPGPSWRAGRSLASWGRGVTGPHTTYERGHHRFEWGDPDRAIIEVEYVRDHRGEVSGEVS